MTTNLSQLKIAQLQSKNKRTLHIYYLPTQIPVACTGPATNMMFLARNGVAEHICFVPLTEMYFLCCTQQLAPQFYMQLVFKTLYVLHSRFPTKKIVSGSLFLAYIYAPPAPLLPTGLL